MVRVENAAVKITDPQNKSLSGKTALSTHGGIAGTHLHTRKHAVDKIVMVHMLHLMMVQNNGKIHL